MAFTIILNSFFSLLEILTLKTVNLAQYLILVQTCRAFALITTIL